MLKIKADRMKDLEKFGFRKYAEPLLADYFRFEENYFICIGAYDFKIKAFNGKITNPLQLYNGFKEIELNKDYIQDIIKADMVEKECGE